MSGRISWTRCRRSGMNGLRVSQAFECLLYSDKVRYELFIIRSDPSLEELEILKIRSVQGHGGNLLSDEMDLTELHKNIFVLADGWRPTLGTRPPVGTQGFLHPNFEATRPNSATSIQSCAMACFQVAFPRTGVLARCL